MKTEVFTRKDNTEGTRYSGEAGDKVIAQASQVGVRENAAIVGKGTPEERAVNIKNYFLSVAVVEDVKGVVNPGTELIMTITGGQKKVLDKTADLNGKTVIFESYEHKDYGTQVGARVLKEMSVSN